jgi:ankyrin repeat protein
MMRNELNTRTRNGWTPLMMSADRGHVEVVKLLLENNADASIALSSGEKAVDLASQNDMSNSRYVEIVQLLNNATKNKP